MTKKNIIIIGLIALFVFIMGVSTSFYFLKNQKTPIKQIENSETEYNTKSNETASKDITTKTSSKTSDESTIEIENETLLKKPANKNEYIQLATLKYKVLSFEETDLLEKDFEQTPAFPKKGTKFVKVKVEITNTSNAPFRINEFGLIVMPDNRYYIEYQNYYEIKGNVSGLLSPNIPMEGLVIFEVPISDSVYYFSIAKGGTKDIFMTKNK